VTAQTISTSLKVPGPITDATTVPNAAGRVGKLKLMTPLAPPTLVSAAALRAAIGLRSTWFTVGVMSLSAPVPSAPVAYGTPLTLIGTVRGVPGVTLEQRVSGGTWQSVGPVASGLLKLTQRPTITTDYRLATTIAAAAFVRIRVAPAIQVTSVHDDRDHRLRAPVLAGSARGGAAAESRRHLDDRRGRIVNDDGTFSVPVALASGGSYRVSVGPATVTPRARLRRRSWRADAPPRAVARPRALAVAAPAAAFAPSDPLAPKQWYLQDDHAFDAWAEPPTTLPGEGRDRRLGIDCSLPEFQGACRTSAASSAATRASTEGHGTFIAASSPRTSTRRRSSGSPTRHSC
jgi:hypothetical protein